MEYLESSFRLASTWSWHVYTIVRDTRSSCGGPPTWKQNETKVKRKQVNMPVVRDVWNVRYGVRLFYSGCMHNWFGHQQKSSKYKIEARRPENSINMHERGCVNPKPKTKIWKMSSYHHALY